MDSPEKFLPRDSTQQVLPRYSKKELLLVDSNRIFCLGTQQIKFIFASSLPEHENITSLINTVILMKRIDGRIRE